MRVAPVLMLVLLSGCSSTPTGKEPAGLHDFKSAANIEVRWERNVGKIGNAGLQAAVTRDAVYVANADGELFRLPPKHHGFA